MKEILERLGQKMDAGFEQVDRRFDKVDERFDKVDERFERVDERFERVDGRLDRIDGRLDQIDGRLDHVDQRFVQVEGRLDHLTALSQKQGVLLESLTGDVKMALEGIEGNREVMDRRFDEVLRKMDERVRPVELATRHVSHTLAAAARGTRTRRKKQG